MTCGDVNFDIVERFFIDDGELNGVDPTHAFVMGVEFSMFRGELLTKTEEFTTVVRLKNVERILKMCWNHKRAADSKESSVGEWVEITVGPKRC